LLIQEIGAFDTTWITAIRVGWRKVVLRVCIVDGSGTSKSPRRGSGHHLRRTQVGELSVLDGQAPDLVRGLAFT